MNPTVRSIQSLMFLAAVAAGGLVAAVGCGTDEGAACEAAQSHVAACSQSLTLDSCTPETAADLLAMSCEDIAAVDDGQRSAMSNSKSKNPCYGQTGCPMHGICYPKGASIGQAFICNGARWTLRYPAYGKGPDIYNQKKPSSPR